MQKQSNLKWIEESKIVTSSRLIYFRRKQRKTLKNKTQFNKNNIKIEQN